MSKYSLKRLIRLPGAGPGVAAAVVHKHMPVVLPSVNTEYVRMEETTMVKNIKPKRNVLLWVKKQWPTRGCVIFPFESPNTKGGIYNILSGGVMVQNEVNIPLLLE